MTGFISRLLSSSDKTADSIVFGGLVSLGGLIGIAAIDVIRNHHEFGPFVFGTGAGAILSAIGGGKTLRDRYSPQGSPPTLPETASEAATGA